MTDAVAEEFAKKHNFQIDGKGPQTWFLPDESLELKDRTRKLFEEYSKITPDDVIPHILKVRQQAWNVKPYPCIGAFNFLDLTSHDSEIYKAETAGVLKGEKVYLDLGCGLGQDLRALVHDGAPAGNLYAADIQADFIELGKVLFRDADRPPANFSVFDIQTLDAAEAKRLGVKGKMDVIHMGAFLHLFDRPSQIAVLKSTITLLAKDGPGATVIGRQVGHMKPGEHWRSDKGSARFLHDDVTFKELWVDVERETGTEWALDIRLNEVTARPENVKSDLNTENIRLLMFKAERVK